MKYRIELSKSAEKQLLDIPKSDQRKIVNRIEKLMENPLPAGYEKLKGSSEEIYRIRQGDYRIIYSIYEEALIVLVIKIGHRREIYR